MASSPIRILSIFCMIGFIACQADGNKSANPTDTASERNSRENVSPSTVSQGEKKKTLDPETYISMKIHLLELEYSYKKHETAAWEKYSGDFDGYKRYVERIYIDYKGQRKKLFQAYGISEEEYESYAKLPGKQKEILDYLNSHPEIADRLRDVISEYDNKKPY